MAAEFAVAMEGARPSCYLQLTYTGRPSVLVPLELSQTMSIGRSAVIIALIDSCPEDCRSKLAPQSEETSAAAPSCRVLSPSQLDLKDYVGKNKRFLCSKCSRFFDNFAVLSREMLQIATPQSQQPGCVVVSVLRKETVKGEPAPSVFQHPYVRSGRHRQSQLVL